MSNETVIIDSDDAAKRLTIEQRYDQLRAIQRAIDERVPRRPTIPESFFVAGQGVGRNRLLDRPAPPNTARPRFVVGRNAAVQMFAGPAGPIVAMRRADAIEAFDQRVSYFGPLPPIASQPSVIPIGSNPSPVVPHLSGVVSGWGGVASDVRLSGAVLGGMLGEPVTASIAAGVATAIIIKGAEAWYQSYEDRNLEGTQRTNFILWAYVQRWGVPPPPGILNAISTRKAWTHDGPYTSKNGLSDLIGQPEYAPERAGDFEDISVEQWVTGMFRQELGREPSPEEVRAVAAGPQAKQRDHAAVKWSLQAREKNVIDMFSGVYGRPPSQIEARRWVTVYLTATIPGAGVYENERAFLTARMVEEKARGGSAQSGQSGMVEEKARGGQSGQHSQRGQQWPLTTATPGADDSAIGLPVIIGVLLLIGGLLLSRSRGAAPAMAGLRLGGRSRSRSGKSKRARAKARG